MKPYNEDRRFDPPYRNPAKLGRDCILPKTFFRLVLFVAFAAVSGSFPCLAAAEDGVPTKAINGFVMVGGVNARNGNYSLTYIAFDGDGGIPYRRTYNSLSDNRGVFGRGWGAVFDTSLIQLPDGRVAVRENGNGALVLYGEPHPDESMDAIERKVLAAEAAGVKSGVRAKDGDVLLLDHEKALQVSACDGAKITRHGNHWVRGVCDNGVQIFDRKGRLTAYSKDGYTVKIYRRFGKIRSLSNNFGQKLRFRYSKKGLRVTSPKGNWYRYDFDPAGYNIRSDSPGSGPISYKYNAQNLLSEVTYMDGTRVEIAYDSQYRVIRQVERTGNTLSFQYGVNEAGIPQTLVVTQRNGEETRIKYSFENAKTGGVR